MDLPEEGRRLDDLEKLVKEIARGVNSQAALLTTVVAAANLVVKKYLELTSAKEAANEAPKVTEG